MGETKHSGWVISCLRQLLTGIFLILFSAGHYGNTFAENRTFPEVDAPSTRYEFSGVFEGQVINHDFLIRNKGEAPLEIIDVKTD